MEFCSTKLGKNNKNVSTDASQLLQLYMMYMSEYYVFIDTHTVFILGLFQVFDNDQLTNIHWHCCKERLKIRKLTKFKGDTLLKWVKLLSQNFTDVFMVAAWNCSPPTNVRKIQHSYRAISSFIFKKSSSNLAPLIIIWRSFQPCWRTFASKWS